MRRTFISGPVGSPPSQGRRETRAVGGHRPAVTARGRALLEQTRKRRHGDM